MTSINDQFAALLSTVSTPGDFYVSGVTEIFQPHLAVAGVGAIALPLLPVQAEQLIAVAERAPYGRGEETRVDTDVRRTWQIGAAQVSIEGQHWARTLALIVARAAAGLGVSDAVVPELYKLLVYDEGSFFVSHRDTEKAPGMFATLIVALPSRHAGGELLVRHRGREVRLEMRCGDPSEAAFAAFYADCVHEVLPVTSGCRLALVYNLLRKGRGRKPEPPSYAVEQAGLSALLARWSDDKRGDDDTLPEKLVYPLAHAYTPAELSFAALKGADLAAASVLTAAARDAACDLRVALLKIEESGSAEHTSYARVGRWSRRDEEDGDEFEIGEVFDRLLTLSHWGRPDGSAADLGEFPFADEELCPADALQDAEPDDEEFQEATGNEGASFERTYQRAALVLWPQHRRMAVLNQAGLPATLPWLAGLARRWVEAGAIMGSTLWCEAHELSGHMLSRWPKAAEYFRPIESSQSAAMLVALAALHDIERIHAFVVDVVAVGSYGKGDNEALLHAVGLLPAAQAGELLERVVSANAALALGACADLLARATARGAALLDHLPGAAQALVEALPGEPAKSSLADHGPRRPTIDSAGVAALMRTLWHFDAALADRAATQLLRWPKTYGMDSVIVPSLHALIDSARSERSDIATYAAAQRLRAAAVDHLRARIVLPLAPPSDWSRAGALDCRCQHCNALSHFLIDASEQTWRFKAAEGARSHVLASIKTGQVDVDSATDATGRPYTLVCTKNQASYERRAAQRKRDLVDLARLG